MTISMATILEHGIPFKEAYYLTIKEKQADYDWAMNDDSRDPLERTLLFWHLNMAKISLENEWAESALCHLSIANCTLYGCLPNMIKTHELHTNDCLNNDLDKKIMSIIRGARTE
jgi:hypothetical protein